jgi:hypothetical protein
MCNGVYVRARIHAKGGNMSLKDTEKAFELTEHRVKVFSHKKKLIVDSEIKRIGHFEVVRGYTIILKSGAEIWLDSGVIDLIVAHESKERSKQ